MDTRRRSIAKTLSYRVLGTIITIMIVLVSTGRLQLAIGIGVLDMVLKIAAYFVHERIWNLIDFGRTGTENKTART
jgi:adenylylsulfate kinase